MIRPSKSNTTASRRHAGARWAVAQRDERVDEAVDGVDVGLDVDGEAAVAGGGRGDRADAGHDRRHRVGAERVEEPLDGGRRGERDHVGATRARRAAASVGAAGTVR